jgi:hypothetical protein
VSGDGVIDLTPDGSDVTLPLPPRTLAAVPEQPEQPAPAREPVATVELRGRRFPVRRQGVSLLSLMKFATLARRGLSVPDDLTDPAAMVPEVMEALTGLYDLLRSCIADEAWDAFEEHAARVGAGGQELMTVVQQAISAANRARPTQPPSGSPDGRSPTAPSSAGGSSSPGWSVPQGSIDVQRRYEEAGRADIAQAVKRAREAAEASTTSSTG